MVQNILRIKTFSGDFFLLKKSHFFLIKVLTAKKQSDIIKETKYNKTFQLFKEGQREEVIHNVHSDTINGFGDASFGSKC